MGPSYFLIGLIGPECCDCGLKEGLEGLPGHGEGGCLEERACT